MATVDAAANNEATFVSNPQEKISGSQYTLKFCRVDTFSFGVTAGRHVVANAWQGTAQHITDSGNEFSSLG